MSFIGVMKALFNKYQQDRGNIIVSSISFYVLLTFIPFTLFSICVLGYVVDLSNPARHLETFIRSAIPAPYDALIVNKILSELNIIAVTKKLVRSSRPCFSSLFHNETFCRYSSLISSHIRPESQKVFSRGNGKSCS